MPQPIKSNFGVLSFHTQNEKLKEKTIVITGPSRSGTTMLAQIIQSLGIPLGDTVDINLFEDVEIRDATRSGDMVAMNTLIADKNRKNAVWGWKLPSSLEYLSSFSSHLRNPFIIFTFRDPVATSVRNQIYEKEINDLITTMEDALNYMKLATQWIRNNKFPCICVSYEKALLNPESLVDAVIQFLHLEPNKPQRFEAIEQIQLGNMRYLFSELWKSHQGFIDSGNEKVLYGWAHNTESNEPAELEIRVNLKRIAIFKANHYRADIHQSGISDGNSAFQFDVEPYLQKGILNRVEVVFTDTEYPLRGSPVFI